MELLRGAGIAMEDIFKNLNADDAIKQFIKLGIQGDSLVNILGLCGMSADDAAKKVAELGSSGVKSTGKLGTAFVNLASKIGISTKALGLTSIGIVAAVTAVAIAVKKHHEGLIESAHEAAQSYQEESDSLSEYGSRISELKKSLESEGISSSEEYNIRAQLLDIQNELIATYGSEAAALDLLTSSADEATAAYERFAAAQSKESASKNLTDNASIIEKSIEAMEKIRTYTIRDVNLQALPQEATKAILDVISKYDAITYDRQDRMIRIEADASEAQEELYSFAEDMRVLERQFAADGIDIGEAAISWVYDDSWSKAIESQLSKVNEVIDEYGSIYDDAIVWKIASEGYTDINNEAKSYNSLMSDITDAQNDFQDAVISSYDSEEERAKAVKASMERINELKSQFGAIAFAEDDLGVRDYFQNMFTQMESALAKEQFRMDITATINGEAPSSAIQAIHNHLSKFVGENGTADEIDIRLAGQEVEAALAAGGGVMSRHAIYNLSEQAKLYWALASACDRYGMTVDDVLSTYSQLGIVVPDVSSAIGAAIADGASKATALQGAIKNLWDAEGFANTRSELEKIAETVTGITPEKIEELADESDALAEVLDQDGMSAEFLAHILQEVAEGRDGLALITDDALRLNKALSGTSGILEKVTKAREKYNAAMSVTEKDDNFKSFSEAFAALNEEFVAGTTNSNKFWAAAEYIFGEDQLEEWGWSDGLAQIRQAMNENIGIFRNAESAGAGFLQKIQTMATATGDILDENGNAIANIKREADGGISFELFDTDSVEKLADKMHLSEEAVLACIEALSMYGDVDFRNIAEVFSAVKDSGYAMEFAGKKVVNVTKLTESMRNLGKTSKEIADIKSDLEGYEVTLIDFNGGIEGVIASLQALGAATQSGDIVDINEAWLAPILHGMALTKEEAASLIDTLSGMSNVSIDKNSALEALEKYDFTSTSASADNATESIDNATNSLEKMSPVANTARAAVESVKAAMVDLNGTKAEIEINVKSNLPNLQDGIPSSIVGAGDRTKKNGGGSTGAPLQVGFAAATGTKHAPAGPALLGDEFSPDGSPKPELVVSDGHAYVAGLDGPEIGYLNDGDVVYPADETRRILSGSRNGVKPYMPAYNDGLNMPGSKKGKLGQLPFALNGSSGTAKDIIFGKPIIITTGPGPDPGLDGKKEIVKTFDELYAEHQHLLAMDQESTAEYLSWLEEAYKEAYENGEIELDDYRKYAEEVYKGQQELFNDYLNDKEFSVDMMEKNGADGDKIIGAYREIMSGIEAEIAAAKARGLTENDDYVQDLMGKWWDYNESISDIETEALEASRDVFQDFLDDTEHQIGIMENKGIDSSQIVNTYKDAMSKIESEIQTAKASGLDENDEYVQELENKWWDYHNNIIDIEKDALNKSRDLFNDSLNDIDHQIEILGRADGNDVQIVSMYRDAMDIIESEIEAAKASGLDSNDDYVQELESKWWDYHDSIAQMEEDALEKSRDQFKEYLSDIDHRIDILGRSDGNEAQIINLYQAAMSEIEAEMEAAKSSGLDSNDDYVQELERQWHDYNDAIKSINEDSTSASMDAVEKLIDFRKDMLKQEIQDEQKALNSRLKSLQEFYDEQKELLQDKYDEEKYLEEQAEKRRSRDQIEAEIATLQRDDSAWAKRRLLELQEELASAEKDLTDFERDHALENATGLLDKLYEQQAESIEAQIEKLDEKLNDPNALYNQALSDIKNNTAELFEEMKAYNNKYGDGRELTVEEMISDAADALNTFFSIFGDHYQGIQLNSLPNASSIGYAGGTPKALPGLHSVDELGPEAVFTSSDGSRYRMLSGTETIFSAKATKFLYNFANAGGSILSGIYDRFTRIADMTKITKSPQIFEAKTGDINIYGNADSKTVSEIRREQRNSIDYILKEFSRLNK